MKALFEIVATYGTENDNQEYWDRLARTYSAGDVIECVSQALRHDSPNIVRNACIFVENAMAHFRTAIKNSEIIPKIEEIAAGDNLRNAHTAVFVLGRISSEKSVEKLRAILAARKHADREFIQNLQVNIRMLSTKNDTAE